MENALYYTLSTIAQTLAGALAILVAVVLFKLSALVHTIERGKETLRTVNLGDFEWFWPRPTDKGREELLRYQKAGGVQAHEKASNRRALEAAYTAWDDWARINQRLYTALGVTVLDIALCFLALPFTRWIACSPWSTGAILVLTVGLGIVSLILYIRLIAAMVRRPAE